MSARTADWQGTDRSPGRTAVRSGLSRPVARPARRAATGPGGDASAAPAQGGPGAALPAGPGRPARPVRGAGKLRQGAAGGRRAAHAEGTARRPESRAESIGCVDVRGSRAGFLNERFTRDNFRYQEQCCQ